MEIIVRATDGDGETQSGEETPALAVRLDRLASASWSPPTLADGIHRGSARRWLRVGWRPYHRHVTRRAVEVLGRRPEPIAIGAC